MTIFHVDIDAFFAQAEQLANPRLRGKPVIVGGTGREEDVSFPPENRSAHVKEQQDRAATVRERSQGAEPSRDGRPTRGVVAADVACRPSGTSLRRFAACDTRPVRGVVAAASYEIREFGVRSGMPLVQALRLCPHAIVVPVNLELYGRLSDELRTIMEGFSPAVEMTSIDEAYLDMSGCERLYPRGWLRAADALKSNVKKKTGLNVSIGVANSYTAAKVASDFAKPNGIAWVFPGKEAEFFAPLPVGMLPGVGPKTAEELEKFGITRVRELARLPEPDLQKIFGKHGKLMLIAARGLDEMPSYDADSMDGRAATRNNRADALNTPPLPSPQAGREQTGESRFRLPPACGGIEGGTLPRASAVNMWSERLSQGEEERVKTIGHEQTFWDATADREKVERHLRYLVCKAATRLRDAKLCTRLVRVKLRYADFNTLTRSRTLADATDDEVALGNAAAAILQAAMTKRMRVRLVGVALGSLEPAKGAQQELFSRRQKAPLRRAVDRLRAKHGLDAILPASAAKTR